MVISDFSIQDAALAYQIRVINSAVKSIVCPLCPVHLYVATTLSLSAKAFECPSCQQCSASEISRQFFWQDGTLDRI